MATESTAGLVNLETNARGWLATATPEQIEALLRALTNAMVTRELPGWAHVARAHAELERANTAPMRPS